MLRTISLACFFLLAALALWKDTVAETAKQARLLVEFQETNRCARPDPTLSADGRWLALKHYPDETLDDIVRTFDLTRSPPKSVPLYDEPRGVLVNQRLSFDVSRLVTVGLEGGEHHRIHIWDLAARKIRHTVEFVGGRKPTKACFLVDNARIAVGYWGCEVEILTFEGGEIKAAPVLKLADPVITLQASPCGKWLLCNDRNEIVTVDVKTFKVAHRRKVTPGMYVSPMTPDGTRYVTRDLTEAKYTVWDTPTGKQVCQVTVPTTEEAHHSDIGAALSRDNRFLATCVSLKKDNDIRGWVHIWDASTGKAICDFQSDDFRTTFIGWTNIDNRLITLGYQASDLRIGHLKLWELTKLPEKTPPP